MPDAIVVGSGPNGLAAAITLARAGLSVRVLESAEQAGGGLRSEALTLPGFIHDACAAVFPLGVASPFFRTLPLERLGVRWLHGNAPVAHARTPDDAIVVSHSLESTAAVFGPAGERYLRLLQPLTRDWLLLLDALLGPPFRRPRHPIAMARFGVRALRSAEAIARRLSDARTAAVWAGIAAHLAAPLERPLSAAPGLLLLAAAHTVGWPVIRGGSGVLRDALVACLAEHGGEIVLGHAVRSLADLPPARVNLLDVSPLQLLQIAGRLQGRYRRHLLEYRPGAALFKLDYALSGPIPWRNPALAMAPTVHLGGSYAEIARGERQVAHGALPLPPFVIAVQPTLFDDTRAPGGKHILWAYCHVPHGSNADMSEAIERRIETFAPGFRDLVLARCVRGPAALERENPSLAGGDFSNGAAAGLQMIFRPALRFDPYATPLPGVFLCSAATPPGPGVHGMCGYWAARSALRYLRIPPPREKRKA